MNRYRLDVLENREGRLLLGGKPYVGVAYEVIGDCVVANYHVDGGLRGGVAEPWDATRERVLHETLEFVELPEPTEQHPVDGYYWRGKLYEGVAYRFDRITGMLRHEEDHRRDSPGRSREWYASGAIRSDTGVARPDGSEVSETYYPNGEVRMCVAEKIRWGQTEHQRLRNLYLEPGYSESELQRVPMKVDTDLLGLTGKGISNETIRRLTHLEDLEKLHLSATAISANGLETLRGCSKLKELLVYPNNDFTEKEVQQLLTCLPNCRWTNRTQ